MNTGLADRKTEIRTEVLQKRAALAPAERAAKSHLIAEQLFRSAAFIHAKTIHLYIAMAAEVQTDMILERTLFLGKRVAAPVIVDNHLCLFEIRSLSPEQFCAGPFGIREPVATPQGEIQKEEVDLWILPGIAYDRQGGRIGFGRGYYDRLLSSLQRGEGQAPVIALAFELQICDQVPSDRTDCNVDQIITEERIIDCGRIHRTGSARGCLTSELNASVEGEAPSGFARGGALPSPVIKERIIDCGSLTMRKGK